MHKEEGGVQASLLINLIGPEGFDVYETFTFEDSTDKDNVDKLIQKFDEYFGVKPNITLARYNFFTRNQEIGESINQYVTALKLLAKNCGFQTLEIELIRDRIVCGIKNAVVRDRLLRTDDLTLDKAIKICQVDEISVDSSRLLETRSVGQGPAHVDAVGVRGGGGAARARGRGWRGRRACGAPASANTYRRDLPSGAGGNCPRCGGNQCGASNQCPAIFVQCYVCENYGHFARMCNLNKTVKKMHDIGLREEKLEEEQDCESFYISMLFNVSEINSLTEDWCEILSCENGSEKFK